MLLSNISCLAVSYLNASQMSNVTIVLLYAALLVIATSMISLRTNDPDSMLAGRNMPWWLIAGFIVGTCISSIAFLAIPAKGYAFDKVYFYYPETSESSQKALLAFLRFQSVQFSGGTPQLSV